MANRGQITLVAIKQGEADLSLKGKKRIGKDTKSQQILEEFQDFEDEDRQRPSQGKKP